MPFRGRGTLNRDGRVVTCPGPLIVICDTVGGLVRDDVLVTCTLEKCAVFMCLWRPNEYVFST